MDLSLLRFFFFSPIKLGPNLSTAENKLNLFLCFTSPFLPFLFQIAKKTSPRCGWGKEVGEKWERDGICYLCRDAFVICVFWEYWALWKSKVLTLHLKTGVWECCFPSCEAASSAPQQPQLFLYGWQNRLTSLGLRLGIRNLCFTQQWLFFLLSFL